MNAKEARKAISNVIPDLRSMQEIKEALRVAHTALCHEEKMERYAEMEAQEEVTLTIKDIMYIQNDVQILERLLHHLPDNVVDHIAFICDAEMKDRYARREKMEKECEA